MSLSGDAFRTIEDMIVGRCAIHRMSSAWWMMPDEIHIPEEIPSGNSSEVSTDSILELIDAGYIRAMEQQDDPAVFSDLKFVCTRKGLEFYQITYKKRDQSSRE